jgi:hypothetical protein
MSDLLNNNCKTRIRPTFGRDVKTEGLLVFVRTALEKGFKRVDDENFKPKVGNKEDTKYVYNNLRRLSNQLKECVVNADYLLSVMQNAKTNPNLQSTAKNEEPLILYYDALAKRIDFHSKTQKIFVPELIVLCMLSQWINEEDKSIALYPFLKEYNFLLLIEKYELNSKNEQKKTMLEMFRIASDLVNILNNSKYKYNKERVSKTRKKRV